MTAQEVRTLAESSEKMRRKRINKIARLRKKVERRERRVYKKVLRRARKGYTFTRFRFWFMYPLDITQRKLKKEGFEVWWGYDNISEFYTVSW